MRPVKYPAALPLICVVLALGACAQLPPALALLPWNDLWGDRGAGVLARDYAMCAQLVEQRRSALRGCMAARGWTLTAP